jgi:hypothetical protein
MSTTKPTAELSDWRFDDSVYFPRLVGIVRNHYDRPDLMDGESIYTSRLLRIDFLANIRDNLAIEYGLVPKPDPSGLVQWTTPHTP